MHSRTVQDWNRQLLYLVRQPAGVEDRTGPQKVTKAQDR
jgi:hypothetical protein